MYKTKKMRSMKNKTSKMGGSGQKCCKATFHGIHKWYTNEFEELGWMILAKNRGMNDKISTYKNSLQRLKSSIEIAMEEIKDSDKKRDLKIMWDNVMILIEHVNKDF